MAEAKNTKKIVSIVSAVSLVVALIVIGVLVLLSKGGDTGPKDPNGDPLYPKASDVASVEYLHRAGLDETTGFALEEKELTDADEIEAFLDTLKAAKLRDPTEKERTSLDYTGAVEMFTLKMKDGDDQSLLMMGKSISINNDNGNYFYMTDDLDLSSLTKDFKDMDIAGKLASE